MTQQQDSSNNGGTCLFHEESKCRIQEEHKEIWTKIDQVEQKIADMEKQVAEYSKNQAVSDEQMKMVFKILNEIKDNIAKLTEQMAANEKERLTQPRALLYSVAASVISALILGGLAYLAIKGVP